MPISDIAIRSAKPAAKLYKLSDGGGLVLHVTPNGGRWWRLRYRFAGAEKMLSLGTYPEVSLRDARDRRDEARKLIAAGTDPSSERKAKKNKALLNHDDTFRALAEEWYHQKKASWAQATRDKLRFYLDSDLLPQLGDRKITAITRPELVDTIRQFENRDAFNVAKKARGWLNQIFRYALAKGVVQINPATDLNVVAAAAPRTRPHASLAQSDLPAFLKAFDAYQGSPLTRYMTKLLLLTGVRPGELRKASWSEFDLQHALWSIPEGRMKMRRPHSVPLPTQAIQILRELHRITGHGHLLFPSRDNPNKPMSDNTVNAAFRRMGYKGQQTGHGFRHLISTSLNDMGFNGDHIERQLAHGDKDKIRGIYNRAEYLQQRHVMMQAWADYLDKIRI